MESLLPISNLNDFVFCPKSIYFHNLYGRLNTRNYHQAAQTAGTIAHQSIDQNRYATSKHILTGLSIYSERYQLTGKIDIYDSQKELLIERKRQIKLIYDGYRYQLYAQYFCLTEMGYPVSKLAFHSLVDNKRYPVAIPDQDRISEFESHLSSIRQFELTKQFVQNPAKCRQCIYIELCDSANFDAIKENDS